jgi:uridine kinase
MRGTDTTNELPGLAAAPGAARLTVGALRDELIARGVRLVALDGPGGGGKSTLARRLAAGWEGARVVEIDDFYRPSSERAEPPRGHGGNYDLPRLLAQVIEPVAGGRETRYQRYDWDADTLAEWHEIPAGAVVLVEGVYSASAPLRPHMDYTIWVECPDDVRLERGLERDGAAMRAMWVERWMPAERRYRDEERPDLSADLVVDGTEAWR